MLRLPSRIDVQLVDSYGMQVSEVNILVAVNLLVSTRYYYGNLVGLTDSAGKASITSEALERRYASDQARFPMDYKLELVQCDSMIDVVLLSEAEVADAKQAIASDFSISPAIRDMYSRARNAQFAPALRRVHADSSSGDPLTIELEAKNLDYRVDH